MSTRRLTLTMLVSLCATLGGLSLSTAPAFAALSFPLDNELIPAGGGFGYVDANGVASDDANGQEYVADASSGTIDIFESSTGAPSVPATLDPSMTPAKSFGEGQVSVAANNGTGDVYVLDVTDNVVDEFNSAGNYLCQITGSSTPSVSECNGVAGSDTPAHGFNSPEGIAVDQSTGEVYVLDANNGVIDIFSLAGAYLRQILLAQVEEKSGEGGVGVASGLAVDDHNNDIYVSDNEPAAVYVFNSLGEYVTTWTGTETPAKTFGGAVEKVSVAADNATGEVFVSTNVSETIDVFKGSTSPEEYLVNHFANPFSSPEAVAVDQANGKVTVISAGFVGGVYGPGVVVPTVTTGVASGVHSTSVTLNGAVNPEGLPVTECVFEYGETTSYDKTQPCAQTLTEINTTLSKNETEPAAVSAEIKGLTPGTTYHFRLKAGNANGSEYGQDGQQATQPLPAITNALASNVTASSADLSALVNPGGVEIKTCVFEYGTEVGVYATQLPCSPTAEHIGAGSAPVPVGVHVVGLEANVTYHWRVIASSEAGTTTGLDHQFVYTTAAEGLPDGRAYEMVSPPRKNGALIGNVIAGGPVEVSEDGSRLIAGSVQCFAGAQACTAGQGTVGSPYLFKRSADGWGTIPLSPPASLFASNGWMLYSADSETALFDAPNPAHGELALYAREPETGDFVEVGPFSPPADGPTGFSVRNDDLLAGYAASEGLSHVVFQDTNSGVGEADLLGWPGEAGESSVFEYAGTGNTEPLLVGVSGGYEAGKNHNLISACGTALGGVTGQVPHGYLSNDGKTVIFTATRKELNGQTCSGGTGANEHTSVPVRELFARIDGEAGDARTVAISQPSLREVNGGEKDVPVVSGSGPDLGCTSTECLKNVNEQANWRDGYFEGASSDSSKVFFTDTQQLTDRATQDPSKTDTAYLGLGCPGTVGENGCNLYLFVSPQEASLSGHNLVDVSEGEGHTVPAGGPRVQGVVAISSDGSHVYFVAKGVLTGSANAEGVSARDGAENLYVYDTETARTSFIADLVPGAAPAGDQEEWEGGLNDPANVTPDGRFLVFTSAGRLTKDDTRSDGGKQVFEYDAQSETLTRISIGEHGFDDDGNAGTGEPFIVPGPFGYRGRAGAGRGDPTMSNNGEYVFFMSPVGLTPDALNDVPVGTIPKGKHGEGGPVYAENVYEYHAGHVSLISDGRDTSYESSILCGTSHEPDYSSTCLLGVDASGHNVFFTTADQLVPQDTDTQVDIYDARVCEAGSPCVQPPAEPQPPCIGEQCHGIPAATPSLLAPGSASFNGAGNLAQAPAVKPKAKPLTRAQKLAKALKVCKKDRSRSKRAKCQKTAHAKYGAVRSKQNKKKR